MASKKSNTEVAAPYNFEEQLARFATKATNVASAAAGSSAWLSFKGGVLQYKGLPLKDNKAQIVILDSVLENLYYEGAYDPNTPATPICYAIAQEQKLLKPHDKAPEPQHDDCPTCPHNAWGSGDKGRGKACKNIARLALIPWAGGTLEDVEGAELSFAKLPVMSVKNFAAHVNNMRDQLNAAPFQVVTEISVVPDAKSQFQVKFDLVESVNKKLWPALLKRATAAELALNPADPYPPQAEPEPQPKRKATAKRKY